MQDADRQHYPVQRQEEALEEDEAEALDLLPAAAASEQIIVTPCTLGRGQ